MELITWDDKYSVGIPDIDAQHQELFKRINDYILDCQNLAGDITVSDTLSI